MSVYDGVYTKNAAEDYAITVDFNDRLASAESISGTPTVTAEDVDTGASATATMIDTANLSVAAGVLTIPIQAGIDGADYIITATATTNATPAATHVAELLVRVRDG